jgi:peptidoglycan hydrolase-like protein with peptidoglycan-binding domain
MTDILWGDPNAKSFRQKFIRRVIVGDARVFVHIRIQQYVEELLTYALDNGVEFKRNDLPDNDYYQSRPFPVLLDGWTEESEDANVRLGLAFRIPSFTSVAEQIAEWGFTQIDDWFIFNQNFLDEIKPDVEENVLDSNAKAGSRELKLGSRGLDVKFINLFVGVTVEDMEYFSQDSADAVKYYQTRMGIAETGYVDWGTWQAIIPKFHIRIASGHAGPRVRALQSAMRCLGYNIPTTSRFGVETLRAVRELQVKHGLRVTGRVGFAEWQILFDRA